MVVNRYDMDQKYHSQQLITLLQSLYNKKLSGTLYLEAEIDSKRKKRSRVLVWKDGYIVFGGIKVPDNQSFVKMLEQNLNREWVDAAASFAVRQTTSQTSTRALLERLVEMQLFSWEEIEAVIYDQVLLTLEQILPHAGQFQFDSKAQFKLCRGLKLSKLILDVAHRQEQWFNFKSLIPSIEAVPYSQADALEMITDPSVHKHLHEWVDGKRSLVDIAEALDQDPLHLAQSYLPWVEAGWVAFEGSTCTARILLPTILAVDESAML